MDVLVNKKLKKWKHPELYSSTTLRYPAPKGVPTFYNNNVVKSKIVRTFVTLDEVWNYKTGEFFWNYKIGEHKIKLEDRYYNYDWYRVKPTGVNFIDYITENAKNSEEVLLSIGRYERELFDGVISFDLYIDAVTKIIEYYKELCPNIVYIEPCNEPQSSPFGGLTINEVVSLYVTIGKIVKELNKKHNYEKPLKFGGYAPACGYELIDSWELFLEKLARVKKSERVIDYYSFHVYSTNLLEVELYVLRHNQKIKELGLPAKPIFVDELGFWYDSPEISANLKNACGTVAHLLNVARLNNVYAFPWCSWHNPDIQMGFTHLFSKDGEYIITPNGFSIKLLTMLNDYEMPISCNRHFGAVATTNKERTEFSVLFANTYDVKRKASFGFVGLKDGEYSVEEYVIDENTNNCFSLNYNGNLNKTSEFTLSKQDGVYTIEKPCLPYSITLWKITLHSHVLCKKAELNKSKNNANNTVIMTD